MAPAFLLLNMLLDGTFSYCTAGVAYCALMGGHRCVGVAEFGRGWGFWLDFLGVG